jgi:(p)ppGpp synthase/HD superfamily hydrolase
MLASISHLISAEGSDILSCQLRTAHNDTGFAAMTIVVRDAPQLERILSRLKNLSGMRRVERRGQPKAHV